MRKLPHKYEEAGRDIGMELRSYDISLGIPPRLSLRGHSRPRADRNLAGRSLREQEGGGDEAPVGQ